MAVYSMTGFGNASATAASAASSEGAAATDSAAVTVELRSVNSRFLDISFRMPDELRQHEGALRDLITAGCRRGKVDVRVSAAKSSGDDWPQPTSDQLNRLSRLEGTVTSWMAQGAAAERERSPALVPFGAACAVGRVDEALMEAGRRAVAALKEARAREGEKLVAHPDGAHRAPARARGPGRAAGAGRRRAPAAALPRTLGRGAEGHRRPRGHRRRPAASPPRRCANAR